MTALVDSVVADGEAGYECGYRSHYSGCRTRARLLTAHISGSVSLFPAPLFSPARVDNFVHVGVRLRPRDLPAASSVVSPSTHQV